MAQGIRGVDGHRHDIPGLQPQVEERHLGLHCRAGPLAVDGCKGDKTIPIGGVANTLVEGVADRGENEALLPVKLQQVIGPDTGDGVACGPIQVGIDEYPGGTATGAREERFRGLDIERQVEPVRYHSHTDQIHIGSDNIMAGIIDQLHTVPVPQLSVDPDPGCVIIGPKQHQQAGADKEYHHSHTGNGHRAPGRAGREPRPEPPEPSAYLPVRSPARQPARPPGRLTASDTLAAPTALTASADIVVHQSVAVDQTVAEREPETIDQAIPRQFAFGGSLSR